MCFSSGSNDPHDHRSFAFIEAPAPMRFNDRLDTAVAAVRAWA
jgi:hypothetical protein